MINCEEINWFEQVSKRYPYDELQKEYMKEINRRRKVSDDTPFVIIYGEIYNYDNNKEYLEALNVAEDLHYLHWGKQAAWRENK